MKWVGRIHHPAYTVGSAVCGIGECSQDAAGGRPFELELLPVRHLCPFVSHDVTVQADPPTTEVAEPLVTGKFLVSKVLLVAVLYHLGSSRGGRAFYLRSGEERVVRREW